MPDKQYIISNTPISGDTDRPMRTIFFEESIESWFNTRWTRDKDKAAKYATIEEAQKQVDFLDHYKHGDFHIILVE